MSTNLYFTNSNDGKEIVFIHSKNFFMAKYIGYTFGAFSFMPKEM